MNFNTNDEFQFRAAPSNKMNQGDEVFFIVNIKELFNVDLNYPGVKTALNYALQAGKSVTPYDTGLMRRSLSLMKLDDYRVKVFYDPRKIIGQKRDGYLVKDYYPIYLSEKAATFNFLTIVMKHFYDALFSMMKSNQKKRDDNENVGIDLYMAVVFMEQLKLEYEKKKEEAKKLREEEKLKQKLKQEKIDKLKKKIREVNNG